MSLQLYQVDQKSYLLDFKSLVDEETGLFLNNSIFFFHNLYFSLSTSKSSITFICMLQLEAQILLVMLQSQHLLGHLFVVVVHNHFQCQWRLYFRFFKIHFLLLTRRVNRLYRLINKHRLHHRPSPNSHKRCNFSKCVLH